MRILTAGVVLTVLASALGVSAQKQVLVVPSTPSSSSRTPAIPKMELGTVEGRIYRNPSLGLELTVANGLEFETPELKGTPGTVPLLVTVTAFREETLLSPRKVTAFYADALAYYPQGQRSTDAYVGKVIRGNRQTGYEPVAPTAKTVFGGVSFARADFRGPLYEVVLVKSCDTQALVIIFASSSKKTVEELIAGTSLKLDPARSGCRVDK